ncbi:MAG: helix-turn-helix domain-containing protein [Deltaproteobacteria bacterium]|nr:helix-turn-helix domain-containing protein [Deltaproteobacteria bacterium]
MPRLRTIQEIHNSKESIAALARRFGVSKRTVRKWKNRGFVEDLKCPRKGQGTSLPPPSGADNSRDKNEATAYTG